MNEKTRIYFGPPLVQLTEKEGNTLEKSGRINITAERYLELVRQHGLDLSQAEKNCLKQICGAGFLTLMEIHELADDVRDSDYSHPEINLEDLAEKLEAASFADILATIEKLNL